jgi:phosphoglycolate phosphatase
MLGLTPHFEDKDVIIWDWNGTLLDDVQLSADIISEILAEHGLPPLSLAEYLQRFRFPVIEYYRDLGFDLGRTAFADLSKTFISRYQSRVHETTSLHLGAGDLLTELTARGQTSAMLSAAHEQDLERLLRHYGVRHHFSHVFGLGDHYAHSKIERGHQLLAALGLPDATAKRVILVGDTDHDYEVAEALGIDVLLLTGGHSTYERLSARHHRVHRR